MSMKFRVISIRFQTYISNDCNPHRMICMIYVDCIFVCNIHNIDDKFDESKLLNSL